MDPKSIGLCPGFESPRCRMFGCNAVLFGEREREKEGRAVGQSPATTALFLGLCHGACSVAATYKPPMLVLRVRLPAGAYALQQHWWGGKKSGAKGRLEMAKVSMRWRVLCRHSLERRNLVQTLFKTLDRLFGMVAPKRTAKSHRPQLYLEPKWLR